MALKRLIAIDDDKLRAAVMRIDELRELLRDVYDEAKNGQPISDGLLSRIRVHAAFGRNRYGALADEILV